ncbi:HAD family hydrolase [Streptomyces sp. OF3]|uniref:HAD family hydrolase n=1 Tax=Streptomyces alkaliterrae TaxID=2213162 RepID=A0A5P0YXD2_9ACTN|nr:HAD family hydrolase [Streptomyces alkaliterrae]MBB1261617.1 HAD family hydrolase [Streptomyces alkaliterrae]MQS03149.1 HAD-IA family hydrolase [Streptomyces alkaliterrae]
MTVRAVLWDVDDTLFDHTGADRAAVLGHLAATGLLSGYVSAEAAWRRWQEVADAQLAALSAGEVDYAGHRRARARAFAGPLGDAEADRWFDAYVARYEAAWALFDDVPPVLDALGGRYRHAVLSNAATTAQDRRLRRLGIRDRFEVVLGADALGRAKPDPEAFRTACRCLGLAPGEVLYVGNDLATDAEAAHAAGLAAVWLDREGARAPGGVPRVRGLDELPALLEGPAPGGVPGPGTGDRPTG